MSPRISVIMTVLFLETLHTFHYFSIPIPYPSLKRCHIYLGNNCLLFSAWLGRYIGQPCVNNVNSIGFQCYWYFIINRLHTDIYNNCGMKSISETIWTWYKTMLSSTSLEILQTITEIYTEYNAWIMHTSDSFTNDWELPPCFSDSIEVNF